MKKIIETRRVNKIAEEFLMRDYKHVNTIIPKSLLKAYEDISVIEDHYILGNVRNDRYTIAKDIYKDSFSIENHVNKIHVSDYIINKNDILCRTISIYFSICSVIPILLLKKQLFGEFYLWYTSDENEEFNDCPSYTMSFGMARDPEIQNMTNVDNFPGIYIITQISICNNSLLCDCKDTVFT